MWIIEYKYIFPDYKCELLNTNINYWILEQFGNHTEWNNCFIKNAPKILHKCILFICLALPIFFSGWDAATAWANYCGPVKSRPQHRELRALLFTNSVCSLTSHRCFCDKGCKTGPPAISPYPKRLESLTICWCNCKGSTFSSVILRPWVMVRPESNSRPPASHPDAQPTEPPVPRKL